MLSEIGRGLILLSQIPRGELDEPLAGELVEILVDAHILALKTKRGQQPTMPQTCHTQWCST